MPDEIPQPSTKHSPLRLLWAILNADVLKLIDVLMDAGQRLASLRNRPGIYEVLEYEAWLELHDTQGHKAVYTKRQKVRFLQDNVIAFQDQAWGDGEIFADYKCSPGVAVDRYREGHRYRVLISLRETKKRGDVQEFRIERTIEDGFTRDEEDWQTEVDHYTNALTLHLTFPQKRPPKHVSLIEQNSARKIVLNGDHIHTFPDGRVEVVWKKDRPRTFEAYILRWQW